MTILKVAMIGDIVGTPGLEALEAGLPVLIQNHKLDFVVVNGENSADGFGLAESDFRRIITAGADVVTSGNHVWEKRDFWPILENEKNMLRPANYANSPGAGFVSVEKNGISWLVINLQGRDLMSAIDCPFQCFDQIVSQNPSKLTLVDFHAESTREKEALGYYADGRVSVFAGTHTHVQTADERILPKGSAYITDLGMTGITDSVIGMESELCLDRFRTQIQYQLKVAHNKNAVIQGIIAEINGDTGKAVSITRF